MKKRKELDALLTMANGKKNGKSKRSKEGHELLRLDSDSNSSDNDELFLAPKKTVIRRPKSCQWCSTCVSLVMFILTVGCIIVTGGLIWMHFNLKQDLDELRLKLEKVEEQAKSVSSQQNTILDLEASLQRMSDLPDMMEITTKKLHNMNISLHNIQAKGKELDGLKTRVETLEGKASSQPTSDLMETVAGIGSTVNGLQTRLDAQEPLITTHGDQLTQLQNDVTILKGQVALLQHPPTAAPPTGPPHTTAQGATPKTTGTDSALSTPGLDASGQPDSQEVLLLWNAVHDVNSTLWTLSSQYEALVASVATIQTRLDSNTTALPPATPSQHSGTPQSLVAGQFDLAQMKADIEQLKVQCNRSIASMPTVGSSTLEDAATNATWLQLLTDRLTGVEDRVTQLSLDGVDQKALSLNQSNQLQFLLERSLEQFKKENLADVASIQQEIETLRTFVSGAEAEMGTRLASHEDQISALKRDCANCSSAATGGPSSAVPLESPVTTHADNGQSPTQTPTDADQSQIGSTTVPR